MSKVNTRVLKAVTDNRDDRTTTWLGISQFIGKFIQNGAEFNTDALILLCETLQINTYNKYIKQLYFAITNNGINSYSNFLLNNLDMDNKIDSMYITDKLLSVFDDTFDKTTFNDNSLHLCNKCNITFCSKILLQTHMKIHDTIEIQNSNSNSNINGNINLICDKCDRLCSNNNDYYNHTKTCKKYYKKCPYCDRYFTNAQALGGHKSRSICKSLYVNNINDNERSTHILYHCNDCNSDFVKINPSNMVTHFCLTYNKSIKNYVGIKVFCIYNKMSDSVHFCIFF